MPDPHDVPAAEYVEAIYEMTEDGIPRLQARLAERLGVSAASVSEAVRRLLRNGLVVSQRRHLLLTPDGETTASLLVRRRRLTEQFLYRILALPWYRSGSEAKRWSRLISDEVEARMTDLLGNPETCPHGNPIPGSPRLVARPPDLRLPDVEAGAIVAIRRISEDPRLDAHAWRHVEETGLLPGTILRIGETAESGAVAVDVNGTRTTLAANTARNIWVFAREAVT